MKNKGEQRRDPMHKGTSKKPKNRRLHLLLRRNQHSPALSGGIHLLGLSLNNNNSAASKRAGAAVDGDGIARKLRFK